MKIHIISTANGQINEGMRNIATHIAKALEADHEVRRSGLKNIGSIVHNSSCCDCTLIFARANKLVYWLARLVTVLSRNVWIVCVQKPDQEFTSLVKKHPLKVNYLTLVEKDLDEIICRPGYEKRHFCAGIQTKKFCPVTASKQRELKEKFGIDPSKPLVVHVGHCSAGRGLEDFATITTAERMIVASGMFENAETITSLDQAGVKIHKGYLQYVEEIYQMADVYFFPTHSTEYVISVPLSVMEALSCGVPVIAYKDFPNVAAIPAEEGAVTLIENKRELDDAIKSILSRKQEKSFLKEPKSWQEVAHEVLEIVRGNKK